MQTTQTTRPFAFGQMSRMVVGIGLAASLAVGAATLTVTDRLPVFQDTERITVTAPAISSDALFALEAEQAIVQADARHAALPQITSDELYALEAALADAQRAGAVLP
jgi:hypothetical protein